MVTRLTVRTVAAFAVVMMISGQATAATAAPPVLVPMPIATVDFDSAGSQLDVEEVPSERAALALWGPIAATRRGASGAGLWCAGTAQSPSVGPSSFFPVYPYFGQLALQQSEPVTLPLTLKRRLTHPGFSGATVSNIVVRSAPGAGVIYKKDRDYAVAKDAQGYTTIQRLSAGTIPGGAVVYVDYKYPSAGTRGVARLQLAQAANYYRTNLSFYYLMPSLGAADANSFSVFWHRTASPNKTDARFGLRKTGASEWRRVDVDLSAGENAPISREAGVVNFQFFDFNDPAGATKNGQGASIDDVVVTGYKYGPPRDLSAAPEGAAMRLTWTKPQRSTTNGAPDERAVAYRVWRRVAGASTWTELTGDRLAAPSFRDETRQAGITYVYLLQAWDSGSGVGYGEPRQWKVSPSGLVTRDAVLTLSSPVSPRFGVGAPMSGRFTDASGTGLEARRVLIERSTSGSGPWSVAATLTTDASGSFGYTALTERSTYYRARFADAEFGTVTSPVRRVLPMVGLSTPALSKRAVRVGERFNVSGTMRPSHATGTRLTIEASRPGAATRRFTVTVRTRTSTSCTWRGTISLPSRGTWRVRVVHLLDALHAKTASGSASVSVR